MNNIITNTGINFDNGRLITNYSCHRTAIQLLKNSGVSESELQAFSRHHSCESLADYCQTSDNQRIMNTAMLIPFLSQELDLDEFEYHDTYGDSLDDELDSDNDYNTNNDAAQPVPATRNSSTKNA
ncbi:32632_t:CDS:2 [Gigaspora margarita]|uniref:32632_t:CDS:1 n=1 Tax=Gigaspora margarita TaxID=4874 RepID=A0ABN7W219_GIGMA|nr:32632_t:CDS:2 [Gigaspora margarita]